MTEKRYFKRMWEEEYYIFDSETISEKEFDEKVEYEDYQAFVDSMQGDEVVDRLNALHEENQSLKFQLDECRNNKLFSRRQLEKENEKLKKQIGNLEHTRDFCAECCERLEKENEKLKSEIREVRGAYAQLWMHKYK